MDNLMVIQGNNLIEKCGILDFQDALWGSSVYDVISLLEDARRTVDPLLAKEIWNLFLEDISLEKHSNYKIAADILAAGRHLKVIGLFTRYALQQQKIVYLNHLPRLWDYLEKCLINSTLYPVKEWFDQHLPLS